MGRLELGADVYSVMDDGVCLLGDGEPASAGGGAALDGRDSGVVAVRQWGWRWGGRRPGEGQRRWDGQE